MIDLGCREYLHLTRSSCKKASLKCARLKCKVLAGSKYPLMLRSWWGFVGLQCGFACLEEHVVKSIAPFKPLSWVNTHLPDGHHDCRWSPGQPHDLNSKEPSSGRRCTSWLRSGGPAPALRTHTPMGQIRDPLAIQCHEVGRNWIKSKDVVVQDVGARLLAVLDDLHEMKNMLFFCALGGKRDKLGHIHKHVDVQAWCVFVCFVRRFKRDTEGLPL